MFTKRISLAAALSIATLSSLATHARADFSHSDTLPGDVLVSKLTPLGSDEGVQVNYRGRGQTFTADAGWNVTAITVRAYEGAAGSGVSLYVDGTEYAGTVPSFTARTNPPNYITYTFNSPLNLAAGLHEFHLIATDNDENLKVFVDEAGGDSYPGGNYVEYVYQSGNYTSVPGADRDMVFAVHGSIVPEPASFGLLAAAAMLLVRRRAPR